MFNFYYESSLFKSILIWFKNENFSKNFKWNMKKVFLLQFY